MDADQRSAVGSPEENEIETLQAQGIEGIQDFLKKRTCYDVLPVSFKLIILDTTLLVRKALSILLQNNIVSAPLWDSATSSFKGLLTSSDFINVILYYYQNVSFPQALQEIEHFKLNELKDVERRIGAPPPETLSVKPDARLFDACSLMITSRSRRVPLIEVDNQSHREMVVSVLTQYRILKFVAVNCPETKKLRKPISELSIGSYGTLISASMDTPVFTVIQQLVERGIASVPIIANDGTLLNVYEAVDVLTLIRAGDYHNLSMTVGQALKRRSPDFPGVHTCLISDHLDGVFDAIRRRRLHRLVVVDEAGKFKGMITLSDIMQYLIRGEKLRKEVGVL